jgi:cytidylate kinase
VAEERVVAIDGPAGSGKSTVAKTLAARLAVPYLDTGAMYRAVAFAALRRGVDPDDTETVARIAEHLELEVADGNVTVDGVDASIEIRGPEVTRAVSAVAAAGSGSGSPATAGRPWSRAGTSARSCSRTPP